MSHNVMPSECSTLPQDVFFPGCWIFLLQSEKPHPLWSTISLIDILTAFRKSDDPEAK